MSMARVFIDGFESGGLDLWDTKSGVTTINGTTKYTGNYAFHITGAGTSFVEKNIPSNATYYFAKKFYLNQTGTGAIISAREGGTVHVNLVSLYSGGSFYISARRANTQVASTGYIISPYVWYFLETYIYVHDSEGRIVVKLTGNTVIDFTGDTRNAGTGTIDNFRLGYDAYNQSLNWLVDDLVVDDSNWIGDTRIVGLSPGGAGNSTQWDPSAGSNYACVDEVPASDADYVSTNVNDEIDTYSLADLSISPYSIKSVQVMARARKEGASTPQNIALVARTGGTDYPGADQALSTAFMGHAKLWEQNPNTAVAWTESDVNGLEAGVKARA
jgi:hypothetical protein